MSSKYRSGAPIETLKTMQKAKHEGRNKDALSAHHGSSHRNKRAERLFRLDSHLSQPAFKLVWRRSLCTGILVVIPEESALEMPSFSARHL
jgi:hypothetical protein